MTTSGHYTREEIFSQPEAWAAALDELNRRREEIRALGQTGPYDLLIFTGCGSTYYLALAAAALCQTLTGAPARALPASELWLYPASAYPLTGRLLLIAVSRSGETSETLRACEAFLADRRGELVTLSCYPQRPLAQMGTLNLIFESGAERSVAQTRAFSTLYLATLGLAALWAGKPELYDQMTRLPAAGRHVLEQAAPLAALFGRNQSLDRFYILGSGTRYGLAAELSLKLKEMSLSHSEPFHFLEFRHGPKSMVTPTTLILGLLSIAQRAPETAVLDEMRALGSKILSIGNESAEIAIAADLDEPLRDILYLPVGQLLAFERALAKGLDPDRPRHLDTVVKI